MPAIMSDTLTTAPVNRAIQHDAGKMDLANASVMLSYAFPAPIYSKYSCEPGGFAC